MEHNHPCLADVGVEFVDEHDVPREVLRPARERAGAAASSAQRRRPGAPQASLRRGDGWLSRVCVGQRTSSSRGWR